MIEAVVPSLFRTLRLMDEEAVTQALFKGKEYPTGLYWYGAHWNADPARKRVRGTEVAWTRRMCEMLPEVLGMRCSDQVNYPRPSGKSCDLVIAMEGGLTFWVEVKPAFKHHWVTKGDLTIYRKHLLSLDEEAWSKSGSAAKDVKKLEDLRAPHASYVGFLLVGFDTKAQAMDEEVEQLRRRTGLDKPPWTEAVDQWDDLYRAGLRDRCWFWWRPSAS
jgi:hypothetical protein